MDKFVIKRSQIALPGRKPIQIRASTYETLKRIQDETGASIIDLVDEMVRFCSERLEVMD